MEYFVTVWAYPILSVAAVIVVAALTDWVKAAAVALFFSAAWVFAWVKVEWAERKRRQ